MNAVRGLLDAHPFRPAVGLGGAHRQTIFGPMARHRPGPPWRLERWDTPDGDFLRLHICEGELDQPAVLIVPGLESDVNAQYVRGVGRELHRRGWGTVALEHRSCGGEMNRTARMYHLGATEDLGWVVGRLAERWPARPLALVGFSLGGNQVAKWLGEEQPSSVVAAAAISTPFDAAGSAPCIGAALGGFYEYRFMRTLRPKALRKLEAFGGDVDPDRVRRSRTLREFDDWFTAPMNGFADAEDYWERTSCRHHLGNIRVPTLLISAADDPFMPPDSFPWPAVEKNESLVGLLTESGGHVGFVGGSVLRPTFWAEEQIGRFMDAVT